MYQDLPRGRKFPKSKRFPYPAFLFLCSYPRLECKDTQIRREEGEERKEGRMDGGGNSIFIWKSGQALPRSGRIREIPFSLPSTLCSDGCNNGIQIISCHFSTFNTCAWRWEDMTLNILHSVRLGLVAILYECRQVV